MAQENNTCAICLSEPVGVMVSCDNRPDHQLHAHCFRDYRSREMNRDENGRVRCAYGCGGRYIDNLDDENEDDACDRACQYPMVILSFIAMFLFYVFYYLVATVVLLLLITFTVPTLLIVFPVQKCINGYRIARNNPRRVRINYRDFFDHLGHDIRTLFRCA